MLYRAEPGTLLIFNADSGRTGALSGKELGIFQEGLQKETGNEFIARLKALRLLPNQIDVRLKQQLLQTIAQTAKVKAPVASFCAPESLHIDLTTVCPLNCKQCYKKPSTVTLSLERFQEIITEAQGMGVFQIALGGGEPLVLEDLPRYVQVVRQTGMACTITTSGWGLSPKRVKALQTAGLSHMQISLNGSMPAIHEHSRDGFAEALNALTLAAQSEFAFGINWVARRDNVADFPNLVKLARTLKVDNLNVLRYKPSLQEDYAATTLTPEVFHTLAHEIKAVRGIRITLDSAFSNLICYLNPDGATPFNCGCGAGRRFMVVDANGRYKPCSHLTMQDETTDLRKYWRDSPSLNQLRTLEKAIGGLCQNCRWLACCGGCRAVAEKVYCALDAGEVNCLVYQERE